MTKIDEDMNRAVYEAADGHYFSAAAGNTAAAVIKQFGQQLSPQTARELSCQSHNAAVLQPGYWENQIAKGFATMGPP